MKSKLIIAASLVSLTVALMSGANANQDAGTTPTGVAQAQPHSHVKERIGSTPTLTPSAKAASVAKAVKSGHDHRSFHKHY